MILSLAVTIIIVVIVVKSNNVALDGKSPLFAADFVSFFLLKSLF
jgi:hypothetical protein